jgi:hypothetical protein
MTRLATRAEMARLLQIDPRNAALDKLTAVAELKSGSSITQLYSISAALMARPDRQQTILELDQARVRRTKGNQAKLSLIRRLEETHGANWFPIAK